MLEALHLKHYQAQIYFKCNFPFQDGFFISEIWWFLCNFSTLWTWYWRLSLALRRGRLSACWGTTGAGLARGRTSQEPRVLTTLDRKWPHWQDSPTTPKQDRIVTFAGPIDSPGITRPWKATNWNPGQPRNWLSKDEQGTGLDTGAPVAQLQQGLGTGLTACEMFGHGHRSQGTLIKAINASWCMQGQAERLAG